MDTASIISEVEAALDTQLQVAGGEAAVEAAGQALLASLAPALRSAAMSLAEQAAEEVRAQLPDYTIDLVISDGEPSILVRSGETTRSFSGEDLAARLTVRLPDILKAELEEAAGDTATSSRRCPRSPDASVARRAASRRRSRHEQATRTVHGRRSSAGRVVHVLR
jgi:hypothetical protein